MHPGARIYALLVPINGIELAIARCKELEKPNRSTSVAGKKASYLHIDISVRVIFNMKGRRLLSGYACGRVRLLELFQMPPRSIRSDDRNTCNSSSEVVAAHRGQ